MKYVVLWLAVVSLLLSGCNGSSSSSSGSSGGSSSGSFVTESFVNDASLRDAMLESQNSSFEPDVVCVPNEGVIEATPQGWLVYERDTPAEAVEHLVVFAHGNGHTVAGSWLGHMRLQLAAARAKGLPVAFVATDYRDNLGFPTLWGAHDTIIATLHALQKFRNVKTVYLLGVSMGGAVSGTAIVEAMKAGITKPADGTPLYDYWIDVEGVSQLAETWSEARAVGDATGNEFAINAADGIEDDAGGTPPECPAAYQRRSPALNAPLFQELAGGVKAATVVHAANDGLVPYNQGREMAAALSGAGVPTQFFTVLTIYEYHDGGKTATSYAPADEEDLKEALREYNDPSETGVIIPPTQFSGHASEDYYFHPVMATAFANLQLMLEGTYREGVPYFECVVDESYDYYAFFTALFGLPLPETCQLDSLPAPPEE